MLTREALRHPWQWTDCFRDLFQQDEGDEASKPVPFDQLSKNSLFSGEEEENDLDAQKLRLDYWYRELVG